MIISAFAIQNSKIKFTEVIILRFSTNALVIKESNIGEQDKLITLLTADRGVIKAYAAGAKSIKSKRAAATGLLSYASFTIDKKGENFRITEATPISLFFGAGSDIVVLSLSQYFCELSAIIEPPPEESQEFLRLILNSLHFLTQKKKNPVLIKAITELRILSTSGYLPNLLACEDCSKFEDDIMYFNIENGSLYCKECMQGVNLLPINRTVLEAMRHIVYSNFDKLYSFSIPETDAELLSNLTERYLLFQTELKITTLDFFNSIK